MQKFSRGYTNSFKSFHNEISTLKCNSYNYIYKYTAHDHSQGILEAKVLHKGNIT